VVGLLADMIEPAPGYETAVEAVLGEALQYIIVRDQNAGARAIDYLQGHSAGRSGFIPAEAVKPLPTAGHEKAPEGLRLLNHVSVSSDFQPIADAMLGHVAVVQAMPEALELFNRNGRIQTIVTRSGDVVSHQGVLIGGSQDQLAGIMAKKQELKTLEKHCVHLDRQIIDARARQQEAEETVKAMEIKLQEAISDHNAAGQESVEAEKALYRIGEDLKNARRHAEITELEQEQLLGEESDLDDQMAEYNKALARITADVQKAQTEAAEASRQIGGLSDRLEGHNQQIVDLKLQLTAYNTKLENGQQTLHRLKEFERDSHVRLEQLQREISNKREKRHSARDQIAVTENSLGHYYDGLKRLETDLESNMSEYQDIDANLKENDGQMAVIQTERQKTLEKIRLLELNLSEKRIMRDNIAGKVQERYHKSIAHLRMQNAQESEKLQMTPQEIKKELDHFQGKISKIGDVNLGAIQEYEDLKERFDFLSEQRTDLEKAIDDLHKVIRKINRITQQRFMETYDQVNQKLTEVFPKLFEGGSARLELTDPGKPLETGVEYMVHPPGKKLTRMSLLSGGEKALSAIAFIFAIFLIRPASFCLLDEIDAPLDEANVVRFNNLMKVIGQKSQIIMITHNKRSMEFAETLYGVTMEQKGISKIVSVNLN
jgi:chromosome segregation protein